MTNDDPRIVAVDHPQPKTLIKVCVLPNRPANLPLPTRATEGSAAIDLAAAEDLELPAGEWRSVRTGLAIEIPFGFEAQIRPRSGLASKHGITVLNSPATIDSDYRGDVTVLLINHGREGYSVHVGDRIAQLVVARVEVVAIEAVAELAPSGRGARGFGHSGR